MFLVNNSIRHLYLYLFFGVNFYIVLFFWSNFYIVLCRACEPLASWAFFLGQIARRWVVHCCVAGPVLEVSKVKEQPLSLQVLSKFSWELR